MFSSKEKHTIAAEIEKLLLALDHPEMPKEKPVFTLNVMGKEGWSWAVITTNWQFDEKNPPGVNPFNEISRDLHKAL